MSVVHMGIVFLNKDRLHQQKREDKEDNPLRAQTGPRKDDEGQKDWSSSAGREGEQYYLSGTRSMGPRSSSDEKEHNSGNKINRGKVREDWREQEEV